MTLELAKILLGAVLFGVTLFGSLTGMPLLVLLKKRETQLWTRLGNPWFWPVPSQRRGEISFRRWYWKGDFREVADPLVRWFATVSRLCGIVFLLCFFLLASASLLGPGL